MELALIKAVKAHSFLYDMNNTNYYKKTLRKETWQKIANDLKLNSGKQSKLSIIILI